MKHADLISQMTLEEKVAFCSGSDYWHTASIERLGIPSILWSDGPHGIRNSVGTHDKDEPKKKDKKGEGMDALLGGIPAVCYPTAATTACSWDPELIYGMGELLGEECIAEKVSVLLGPGTNMKRSPLCGRNFEYFSEDPYLAGKMSAAFINGVQSKGIGTSLKHYAVNSQETRRMTVSAVVDERTLREIYLTAYEIAVKESQPWTIMCMYNRLNGVYGAENKWLLTDVLRHDFGFEGMIVTDWAQRTTAFSVCSQVRTSRCPPRTATATERYMTQSSAARSARTSSMRWSTALLMLSCAQRKFLQMARATMRVSITRRHARLRARAWCFSRTTTISCP